MASKYMWGCGYGHVVATTARRLDRIARKVGGPGCGFANCEPTPGLPQFWFFGPNDGAPFDGDRANAIQAAVDKAGIVYPTA